MIDWAEEKARWVVEMSADGSLVNNIAALLRQEVREREYDYDGLEADLAAVLDVLWRRGDEGGRDFIRRNYPGFDPERPFETIRSTIKEADG